MRVLGACRGPWSGFFPFLLAVAAAFEALADEAGACREGPAGGTCATVDVAEAEEASLLHVQRARRSQPSGEPKKRQFLWISDFHMDPHYGKGPAGAMMAQACWTDVAKTGPNKFGTMGCDPPPALVESALVAAKELTGSAAEFVVFSGDFSRHEMQMLKDPTDGVAQIIGDVSGMIKAQFPTVPMIFGALGNDDNPANYFTNVTTELPENPWFSKVGAAFTGKGVMPESAAQKYKYGSFYAQDMGGVRFLTISTVMYSHKHQPDSDEDDPFGQFAWLRSELKKAADEDKKVWIVGHIPPGIETFGYSATWQSRYLKQYLDIVQDEALGSTIAAQLFGHVHKDEFRVLPKTPAGGGPLLLSSSVSPCYYNNPSFRLVEYCPWTGRLLNYKVFWAQLTTGAEPLEWRPGYDLRTEYAAFQEHGAGLGFTAAPFRTLAEQLLQGEEEYDKYASWYATQLSTGLQQYSEEGDTANGDKSYRKDRRQQYVCALTVLDQDGYEECAEASLGKALDLKAIMKTLPKTWEDKVYFKVSYLLHWAVRAHHSKLAHKVRELAAKGHWKEILEIIHRLHEKHPEWHREPDE